MSVVILPCWANRRVDAFRCGQALAFTRSKLSIHLLLIVPSFYVLIGLCGWNCIVSECVKILPLTSNVSIKVGVWEVVSWSRSTNVTHCRLRRDEMINFVMEIFSAKCPPEVWVCSKGEVLKRSTWIHRWSSLIEVEMVTKVAKVLLDECFCLFP